MGRDAGVFVALFWLVLPKKASRHKNQQILSFQQKMQIVFFSIKAWKM
jgi:hypothetical protein